MPKWRAQALLSTPRSITQNTLSRRAPMRERAHGTMNGRGFDFLRPW
jgi:hypothetical protein